MKFFSFIALIAGLTACQARAQNWIPLFNGKDLDGWTPRFAEMPVGENHHQIFRVEDGMLKISYADSVKFDGRFGHLFYKTPFSHYRIRAEFRFTGEQLEGGPEWAFRNNGFMLHSQSPQTMTPEQNFPNSIEMQFWGNDPEKNPKFSGRPMGNLFTPGTKVTLDGKESEGGGTTSSSPYFSGLDWVTVEAEVHGGEEIIHYVNGQEVLRYQTPKLDDGTPLTSGFIAIQAETHNTEFRKIELLLLPGNSSSPLDEMFVTPPDESKPWCYWYWLNNNISKDGVTKDLETMNKVGIKLAMIGNIEGGGPVKMFSPEWYAITRHALKEANRLSIELMMFNAPGWSQSGGPWITPEQSMRRVAWTEVPAKGGAFSAKVRPDKAQASQDIAVLAVPRKSAVSIDGVEQNKALRFSQTAPFTARALVVHGKGKGKLYALKDGKRELIADIDANGGSPKTDFLANEIETFSFPDVSAQEFELEGNFKPQVTLTSEPKVAQVIEKQMGRMHPTPSPTWESYIFPDSVEPGDPSTVLQQKTVLNLTENLGADGILTCTLPKGEWTIIHFGMASTGKKNAPAPPEATGLECDKMSKKHIRHHFDSMFGKLIKQLTPEEKSAWTGITIDSYEVGSQNWTDGFAADFEKRNGYSPLLMLPVMTGRVIDSAKASDQFLWDLRRTVADLIAENYVGGLSEISHENGLRLWCENYGHWGFPGDFTVYGGHSDEIGGEFWVGQPLGSIECRAASSTAHIYGKRRVFAEAFTSKIDFGSHPAMIKARGEELFCEGINHFVLHVYAHQTSDGAPGKNPWFGTPFHRNTPWFMESRDWVKYLQRCHTMLQQGDPVADVAVYIGDFAPQMTGPANPVPVGYDYDYMGSDAILRKLQVVDGEWVVYDEKNPKRIAARWKILALPKNQHARPQVLKRIEELKKAGGKVIDGVPVNAAILQDAGITPLVSDTTCPLRWKARRLDDGMLFFLSNFNKAGTFEATLRVTNMVPELFDPVTGQITKLARFQSVKNGTRITIDIKDLSDSCFLVFRNKLTHPSVVKADIPPAQLALFFDPNGQLSAESSSPINTTLALSDGSKRNLIIEESAETFAIDPPWKSTNADDKGFSVIQETSFNLPAAFGKDKQVTLDLGQVSVMAKVTLNGKTCDTLWRAPFTLDVTNMIKPGSNQLKVLVTSTSQGKPALGEVVLRTSKRVIVK